MMRNLVTVSSYSFRLRLVFISIFFAMFFYAQSFGNYNPAITVIDGSYISITDSISITNSETEVQNVYDHNTNVYISEHTIVSGIEHFENAELHKIKETLYEPEKKIAVKQKLKTHHALKRTAAENLVRTDIQYSENKKNTVLRITEYCNTTASGSTSLAKIKAVLQKSYTGKLFNPSGSTQEFSYVYRQYSQLFPDDYYSRPPPSTPHNGSHLLT